MALNLISTLGVPILHQFALRSWDPERNLLVVFTIFTACSIRSCFRPTQSIGGLRTVPWLLSLPRTTFCGFLIAGVSTRPELKQRPQAGWFDVCSHMIIPKFVYLYFTERLQVIYSPRESRAQFPSSEWFSFCCWYLALRGEERRKEVERGGLSPHPQHQSSPIIPSLVGFKS